MSKTDVLGNSENKVQQFVIANSKNLLWLIVGLLIAAGGLVGYSFVSQSKEQKADGAFAEVEKTFKEKQKTKLGADLNADFGSTLEGYRKVITEYSGTTAATMAAINLGRLYYDYKKFDEQIGILETAVKTANNHNMKGLTLSLLGVGYDAKGDCNKAIDTWLKIESNSDLKFLAPDAALKIAACQQKLGDAGAAKKTYERITRDYNDDQVAVGQAKKFLKTL